MRHDFAVIGGGIVGLATARELLRRRPGASLVLLEKEDQVARHQTGHNSGVIHAGVYYAPGSLKARLCKRGERMTKEYCAARGVAFRTPGKLIVATNDTERQRLATLGANARTNGLTVFDLDAAGLRAREPNIAGVAALRVPETGIVDYPGVCRALAGDITAEGGEIRLGWEVAAIRETAADVRVEAGAGSIAARHLVVCAGLQADRMVERAGEVPDFQIVPFRGEYYTLAPGLSTLISHMIYPVPDPALPFLGIHLTPMIDGTVTVGPNAVLGLARERYAKFRPDLRDMARYLTYPGFWRLIGGNLRSGIAEATDSLFKEAYLQKCRKYCPSLTAADLRPRTAGIRAQAVDRSGTLIHDFLFRQSTRVLHVCNAPSPAATAALPIAEMIVARMLGDAAAADAPDLP